MLERLTRWKYFQLLSGVYLAMFLIRVAFGIVIITFGHYVTANDFVFGLLVSATPLFELVCVVFAGIIVDRYGRKQVLLAGLALGALSLYLLALAKPQQFLLLGLSQAIHGIAAGFILVTTLAIITAYAPAEKRGREMGLFNFVNLFGWIFGFALGSILLDIVGDLRYTFVLAGFLATVGLVYGHVNIREPKRHGEVERIDFGQLARVFSNRRVQVLSAAWLVIFVSVGSLIAFFSRVAVPIDPHGIPVETAAEEVVDSAARGTQVALVILGVGALFMVSQLIFGKLSDRYGRERLMILGAVGFVAFTMTSLFGASLDPREGFTVAHPFVTVALVATSFVTLAFAPAGLAALADEATKRTEGTTMSAYSIVLNVGMITGPPLLGAVSTLGGANAIPFFFVAASGVLLALTLVRFYQVRADLVNEMLHEVPVQEAGARNR